MSMWFIRDTIAKGSRRNIPYPIQRRYDIMAELSAFYQLKLIVNSQHASCEPCRLFLRETIIAFLLHEICRETTSFRILRLQ